MFTVSLSDSFSDSFSDSVVVSFCVSLSVSLSFCASAGILNAVTECGARLYFAVFSVTEILSEDLFLSGLFRL